MSTPLKVWVSVPYLSASVVRLLIWPDSDGTISYSPEMAYPPPPGSLESIGAVMLYGV